jgi:hypothetical protein
MVKRPIFKLLPFTRAFAKLFGAGMLFLTSNCTHCQVFQDVSNYMGIQVVNANSLDGQGISFHDFNRDGLDDLTFAIAWQDPKFYINNGNNTFTLLEPFFSNNKKIRSIQWVDFDNDGDSDLFVTFDEDPYQLWKQTENLNFINVSGEAGFWESDASHYASSWGDFDRDGYLDLYISTYYNPGMSYSIQHMNHVYRNLGDGTFENITLPSNAGDGFKSTLATVILDYNNDLWPDIYSVNDKDMGNGLYRNDSTNMFVDVSFPSNSNAMIFGMSASSADYDNDGYLDMYCTNDPGGNVLLRNNGAGGFINTSAFSGTQLFEMCWAANWLDYDNNGYQDLYVSTQGGYAAGQWTGGQNHLLNNNGNGTFAAIELSVNLISDTALSYCTAVGDFNNDGYPDIAQNNLYPFPSKLYKNSGGTNHFISVELEGKVSNRDGIGCWIKVYVNDQCLSRYTHLGENYMGQNSQRELFGLGQTSVCDSVVVLWPSGHKDSFYNISSNQWLSIEEGSTLQANVIGETNYICLNDSLLLTTTGLGSHLWSTGETTESIYVDSPGWYSAEITTELGLVYTSNPIFIALIPEPNIEQNLHSPSCYGASDGFIELAGDNVELADIFWSVENIGLLLDSIPSGSYSCVIVDTLGCSVGLSFIISEPEVLAATADTYDVSCWGFSDGYASFLVTGGVQPFEIQTPGFDPNALAAGAYEILVVDSNQCFTTLEFQIIEPDSLHVEFEFFPIVKDGNGSIEANVTGGIEPYHYAWSNGDTTATVLVFDPSFYWVEITDDNGCVKEAIIEVPLFIDQNWTSALRGVPNPFEDQLNIIGVSQGKVSFQFIDSFGQVILSGVANEQDHIVSTSILPAGIWILQMEQPTKTTRQTLVKL